MVLVEWAEQAAGKFLRSALPRRWAHVRSVAARAGELAAALGDDGEMLHAAAWLHDVGYAPPLAMTEFHPLDGARHLATTDVPDRLVGLVAFHSSAASEAEALGLADQLAEFDDERSVTRDLLWYVDMTVGPDGQCMDFAARMDDVRAPYAPNHYVIRALDAGMRSASPRSLALRRGWQRWGRTVRCSTAGHGWRSRATLLIHNGAAVKTVQLALGHSSPMITLNTYAHEWPDAIDRTRALVDAALAPAGASEASEA